MTIDAAYLSQMFMTVLVLIIGWLIRGKLGQIESELQQVRDKSISNGERLIRIETKLNISATHAD